MSTGAALVRILAALSVSAAPAAAFAGPSPAISTSDVTSVVPGGQVQNTGGNVVIGTSGTSQPPTNPPSAPAVPAPTPAVHPHVRPAPAAPTADAAVAKARQEAEAARQRGLAQAEEARRRAAEASARAHSRADEARNQSHAQATTASDGTDR